MILLNLYIKRKNQMKKVTYSGSKYNKDSIISDLLGIIRQNCHFEIKQCAVCGWVSEEDNFKQCHSGSGNWCCEDCMSDATNDRKKICSGCPELDSDSEEEEEKEEVEKEEEKTNKSSNEEKTIKFPATKERFQPTKTEHDKIINHLKELFFQLKAPIVTCDLCDWIDISNDFVECHQKSNFWCCPSCVKKAQEQDRSLCQNKCTLDDEDSESFPWDVDETLIKFGGDNEKSQLPPENSSL
jgi:hypothetical protein